MPRSPRIDYRGARHHVMNRASNRRTILFDDAGAVDFVGVISELPERFGVEVHGYALMPNHFHLMLVSEGNLSRAMQWVGHAFTRAVHLREGGDGPVFRGRFRSRLVEDEAYWRHLLAYLHLNPVRAKLCKRPEECVWTSHLAYAERPPSWLKTGELLELWGGRSQLLSAIEELRLKRVDDPSGFGEQLWEAPVAVVRPTEPLPRRTLEQALAEVAGVTGLSGEAVLEVPRGRRPNRAMWLAVWWMLASTDADQREVAERIGVARSRVSQVRARFLAALLTEPELVGWRDALVRNSGVHFSM